MRFHDTKQAFSSRGDLRSAERAPNVGELILDASAPPGAVLALAIRVDCGRFSPAMIVGRAKAAVVGPRGGSETWHRLEAMLLGVLLPIPTDSGHTGSSANHASARAPPPTTAPSFIGPRARLQQDLS